MKKLLLYIIALIIKALLTTASAQSPVTLQDGYYIAMTKPVESEPAKATDKQFKTKAGEVYPIFLSKNGKYYVNRISKSGKKYRQYILITN